MKLITAIIHKSDVNEVGRHLTKASYYFTKIATMGGFLQQGNVTLLIGVEDDKVKDVLNIIREHSSRRKEMVPEFVYHEPLDFITSTPVEVEVGGATVFVTNVEYFEKM